MLRGRRTRLVAILLVAVLATWGATGCLRQQEPVKQQPATGEVRQGQRTPLRVTFAGSSPGGPWYMVMSGVAECINRSFPGSAVTVVPGEGVSNLTRVAERQADMGLSHSAIVAAALKGQEPFKSQLTNVAVVGSLYPSYLQVVATKKTGLASVEDFVQKRYPIKISVDSPGSTGELALRRALAEYGVTYKDIEAWGGKVLFKGPGDSADMLGDGTIDAMSTMTLYPAPPIQEAGTRRDLVLLPLSKDVISKLADKYGYGSGVIPAGAYKFNPEEAPTVTSYTVVIVPADAPEQLAYSVALSICENLDYLRSVHAALAQLTKEQLVQNTGGPLHPGAAKYYREVGVLTSK